MAKRFDVWIVRLEPVLGSEIGKTRPCVIISPDEANNALNTVLVAPLTSTVKGWPTRVAVKVKQKSGEVALDQIRAVDKKRLAKKSATLSADEAKSVADRLAEMFRL